jgi:hypothetical protein
MTLSGFETPIAAPTKQNEIKMCDSKAFGTRCVRGQGNPRGNTLLSDQRGAVAFETISVYFFLGISLLLPLADVAVAGFQYISTWEALRGFGQSVQYAPPPDVTNVSSAWTSSVNANAATAGLQNFGIQLVCGDSNIACSATNPDSTNPNKPKYYSYTTTVTLAPMVLRPVLCTSGNTNPCSFTLSYSERFQ